MHVCRLQSCVYRETLMLRIVIIYKYRGMPLHSIVLCGFRTPLPRTNSIAIPAVVDIV